MYSKTRSRVVYPDSDNRFPCGLRIFTFTFEIINFKPNVKCGNSRNYYCYHLRLVKLVGYYYLDHIDFIGYQKPVMWV